MAAGTLTVYKVTSDGVRVIPVTPTATYGDKFKNNGRTRIRIKNGSLSSVNATFVTPGTIDGNAIADKVVAVPAGQTFEVSRLPPKRYNDGDGYCTVILSAVSDVEIDASEARPL